MRMVYGYLLLNSKPISLQVKTSCVRGLKILLFKYIRATKLLGPRIHELSVNENCAGEKKCLKINIYLKNKSNSSLHSGIEQNNHKLFSIKLRFCW